MAEAREIRTEQSRRWHTWHVAALPNVKTFPSFREFMGPAAPATRQPASRRQTIEEQIAIALQWTAATAGRR